LVDRRVNLFDDVWDDERAEPGYRWKRRYVGRALDGELLGASLLELEPGQKSFPYHFQYANEELLIVLAGRPTLREPSGERELAAGDVAIFRRGPDGAHQILNRTEEPTRILVVSTMIGPDVSEYPDSGKIGAFAEAPGTAGDWFHAYLRVADQVEYFEGEREQ
jgi:uncharacterized cupin superfamily protein